MLCCGCGVSLVPHQGFDSVLLFVFLLGPKLKRQHLPAETLLLVMAEVAEGKTNCTKTFQISLYLSFCNIPLAKSSDSKAVGAGKCASVHHEAKRKTYGQAEPLMGRKIIYSFHGGGVGVEDIDYFQRKTKFIIRYKKMRCNQPY